MTPTTYNFLVQTRERSLNCIKFLFQYCKVHRLKLKLAPGLKGAVQICPQKYKFVPKRLLVYLPFSHQWKCMSKAYLVFKNGGTKATFRGTLDSLERFLEQNQHKMHSVQQHW